MTRLLGILLALTSGAVLASGFSLRAARSDAWVVVQGRESATVSGSMLDLRRARTHLRGARTDFLWFRRDGKEWLVEDPALVARMLDVVRPQQDVRHRQAALRQARRQPGDEERLRALEREDDRISREVERDAAALIDQALNTGAAHDAG